MDCFEKLISIEPLGPTLNCDYRPLLPPSLSNYGLFALSSILNEA